MPDYIYLLENRLSADQRLALTQVQTVARDAGLLLFLTGDAVRDLTSGHSVRDLEMVLHGNALKLKKPLEKLGGQLWGEDEASRTLYLCYPGTVRVDLVSAHGIEYPKPGKPVYHFDSIHEDLARRDFTINAMALSLNEGSYGLLMDPFNGAADIETHTLRLVSNYGFLEEPAFLVRSTRLRSRLGWEMDPRTQARYENAKNEGVIEYLSARERGRELEQIGHEEDGLSILRALDDEGWMKLLLPAWTPAKADEAKLNALYELNVSLQLQNVHPDISAAQMQLLTAKLQPKDLATLKKSLLRPGFVAEWNSLDSLASGFSKELLAKQNAQPSASYKLFLSYDPEAILWLGFTSKAQSVRDRFDLFLKTWPEVRQRIPHALMQELRITPELPNYNEIVEKIFLSLIDGGLTTPEEMRAFLEPYSPPLPPPSAPVKRTRARRAGAKKNEDLDEEEHESDDSDDDLSDDDESEDDDGENDLDIKLPKDALAVDLDDEEESDADEEATDEPDEDEDAEAADKKPAPAVKKAQKPAPAPIKQAPAPAEAKTLPVAKSKPAPEKAKLAPQKPAPAPIKPAPASAKAKSAPAKSVKTAAAKPTSKVEPKRPANSAPKPPVAKKKPAPAPAKAKPAPAKPAKPAAKKPAPKPAKKH